MLDINNYYERLVSDRLWKLLEHMPDDFDRARLEDIACLALNQLPPCYVCSTVDMGAHLSEKTYQEMETRVLQAVDQAIEQGKRYPQRETRD
jgi:hypothetical protein